MQIVLSMEFNSGEEKTHICSYCGRRFSSGKALGGHKRFHIQQERQAAAEAVAKACTDQDSGGNNNNNNGSSRFYCPVCPKHFPSLKSVSGHMRTHGDRVWRGINPPAPADNNLHNKPTTTTTTVDLLQSLPSNWSNIGALGGHSSTHNKDNNHKKNCTTKKMDSKLLRPNKYFYGDQGSGHGDVLQIMMGSSISSSSQLIAMDHGGNCSSTAAERRRTLDIDLNELPVMSVTDV
ncbi:hypothetical protein F8388_021741 [Cannabis sativa]|uniref:C2H2-type domain-containing protein n=1 Tax=Cannabis sativa TaxID=3483 RepID=A0A7J6E7M6_CANSA|nr:hypothetical protein F8388_021741 [Cannabis sativa]